LTGSSNWGALRIDCSVRLKDPDSYFYPAQRPHPVDFSAHNKRERAGSLLWPSEQKHLRTKRPSKDLVMAIIGNLRWPNNA
jgi:hypothetical protein